MHLARLTIVNYRIFGASPTVFDLHPGLNILLGENDSGKSSVLDALRVLLGTTPPDYFTIGPEDFHCAAGQRAATIDITAHFAGISSDNAHPFLEYLTAETVGGQTSYTLTVHLHAELDETLPRNARRSPVRIELRAGADPDGRRFDGPARDLLRATYLKPLRDAIAELAPRRGSRLSHILGSTPSIQSHGVSDWSPGSDSTPTTIIGLMRRAEHDIRSLPAIQTTETHLNARYLRRFSLGDTPMEARIGVSAADLRHVLERMELTLAAHEAGVMRGLGMHNALFIGAELLALARDTDPCLPLVLIEEPEAHLHPQLQLRLVEFFQEEALAEGPGSRLQVLLTSHSPNIASKVGLASIILLAAGSAFPLGPSHTALREEDYDFLERFLDVTKADLFFARGLLIVEGDAECLLLPTLAELLGCSLTAAGVSVVNVGGVGLYRYSRIFQRPTGPPIPVRVARLTDLDVPPDDARPDIRSGRRTLSDYPPAELEQLRASKADGDGDPVRTFVSPHWTLEYDLAVQGLGTYVNRAIHLALATNRGRRALTNDERTSTLAAADATLADLAGEGLSPSAIAYHIYRPLLRGRASKAETAQYLAHLLREQFAGRPNELRLLIPRYIIDAIAYATRSSSLAET